MAFINKNLNPFREGRNPFRNIMFEQEQEEQIPYREMQDDYDMETPSLSAYREHINAVPSRSDFSPSVWRRLAAGLIGGSASLSSPVAGQQIGERIVNRPYERALQDWSIKEEGLRRASTIEGQNEGRGITYRNAMLRKETEDIKDKTRNRQIDVGIERFEKELGVKEFDAETRRKSTELTAKRDAAVDEREKKRINAQIENWKQTRANERTRIASQEKASLARTEAYKNRPVGNTARTRYNDPTKVKQAELGAAQELFNTGEYEDIKEYIQPGPNGIQVNIPKDGVIWKYGKQRERIQNFIKEMKKRALARYNSEFGTSPYIDDSDDDLVIEEQ